MQQLSKAGILCNIVETSWDIMQYNGEKLRNYAIQWRNLILWNSGVKRNILVRNHAIGPKNKGMFCISVMWLIFNHYRGGKYISDTSNYTVHTTRLRHMGGKKPLTWRGSPWCRDASFSLSWSYAQNQLLRFTAPVSSLPDPKNPLHPAPTTPVSMLTNRR